MIETNTRKIIGRLEAKGWINVGGTKHAKYEHTDKPGVTITVPRHRQVKPGTARGIAKTAGWI
jgi:predicted RNA binding protein YcfA (HicA-like mRNA interferase family)